MWRQLTSMRTALLLLLLLAVAAVPGSLVPQRSSDPNGVIQLFRNDPDRARLLDALGLFSVYSSPWFSAIYILLFVSLVGCVIPRARHHARALRQSPPPTPRRLDRLPVYRRVEAGALASPARAEILRAAESALRTRRYRVSVFGADGSVAAERGYARETGNLVFHISLVGVLVSFGIVSGFGFVGQRVVVQGESFATSRGSFDSFTAGRFFNDDMLPRFALTLDDFSVSYVEDSIGALGFITDYSASVGVTSSGAPGARRAVVKVNEPTNVSGTEIYLLGNGFAPRLVIRDPSGRVAFSETIPFLPQDTNLTSVGVVKVPDGLAEQVGLVGFFYPTRATLDSGASASVYPDLQNPVLTLNVFTGDLGVDSGTPRSVYSLDTSRMTQLTGGSSGVESIELRPGESAELPGGLGSIEFSGVRRFASFDVASDPSKVPTLVFTITALIGLALALFVPRRRIWVRVIGTSVEFAGLARGDDPTLDEAVDVVVDQLRPLVTPHDPHLTGAEQ